ncbi:MAG TPA: hypothetical protein VKS22_06640 [Candidatus Binataceae bacterium]|nr:hypothetical protein [Candidatus Binataceae bacterium]
MGKRGTFIATLAAALLTSAALALALPSPTPTPSGAQNGVYQVNYYSNAGSTTDPDGTVRIVNPSGSSLCALIYVTDEDQELRECCGCNVTDRGTRILSVDTDLTSNPANGVSTVNGSVAIVSSSATNCDASLAKTSGNLAAYETHPQNDGTLTEDEFTPSPLSRPELNGLQTACAAIELVGSGKGICSCGTGG